MMSDQLNLLYIFTDQHTANAMSCAGCTDIDTPAMDRLANEGVRFENAYCTYPLCTPSRASMFSGRWPHGCGVMYNELSMSRESREHGIGNLLSAAGYDCAYGGKWHVPWASPMEKRHGFEYINAFDDFTLADDVIAFLEQPRKRPFFAVASFDSPHNICEYGSGRPLPWGAIPEPASLAECPNLPLNYMPSTHEAEAGLRMRRKDYTLDDWRRYRFAYYRMIEQVDTWIGRILDALDRLGLASNTVVVFSSDHGEMAGAHQMATKLVLHEESINVPFIVRAPGARAGSTSDALISNGLDLYPTLCDYAGVKPSFDCPGLSVRSLVEGSTPGNWRGHVVSMTRFGREGGLNGRMLRTQRYKYIAYEHGFHREQLFDLSEDPGEMINLAYSARHAGELQKHRDLFRTWCAETGDNFGYHYTHPRVPFIVPGDNYPPDSGGLPPVGFEMNEPPD